MSGFGLVDDELIVGGWRLIVGRWRIVGGWRNIGWWAGEAISKICVFGRFLMCFALFICFSFVFGRVPTFLLVF